MIISIDAGWRVRASISFVAPLARADAWRRARDIERFAALDPLHARLRVLGPRAAAGAPLVIEHRFAGVAIDRIGRILRWDDGVGYTFSDLSARSPRVGFPHVIEVRLDDDQRGVRWTYTIRGRWTARRIPRWIARLWIRWILAHIAEAVRRDLLRAALSPPSSSVSLCLPLRSSSSRLFANFAFLPQSASNRRRISSPSNLSTTSSRSPASSAARPNDSFRRWSTAMSSLKR